MEHQEKYNLSLIKRLIVFIPLFIYWLYFLVFIKMLMMFSPFGLVVGPLTILEGFLLFSILKWGRKPWISFLAISGLYVSDKIFFTYIYGITLSIEVMWLGLMMIGLLLFMTIMLKLVLTFKSFQKFIRIILPIFLLISIILVNSGGQSFSFLSQFPLIANNAIVLFCHIVLLAVIVICVHVEEKEPSAYEKKYLETIEHKRMEDKVTKNASVFTGNTFAYIGISLLTFIVSVITLGFGLPFMVCYKESWMAKHTHLGEQTLYFNGRGMDLFGKWLLWLLLSVVTIGIFSLFIPVRLKKWKVAHTLLV